MTKQDDLSVEHLEWLVESRAKIQRAALDLFKLFEAHPQKCKGKEYAPLAHALVGVSFSLWRAAFLADKIGTREKVFEDARAFLGKMLIDNAITYLQDRNAREWTFNYYMNISRERLDFLDKTWSGLTKTLDAPYFRTSKPHPKKRWERHHGVLTIAIQRFAKSLNGL